MSRAAPWMPVGLTEAQKVDVVSRYDAGATSRQLAQEFGTTPQTIMDWVRAHGGTPRPIGRPRLAPETRREIACLYVAGGTSTALAGKYGVSVSAVIAYVREHGGTVRRKGPQSKPR